MIRSRTNNQNLQITARWDDIATYQLAPAIPTVTAPLHVNPNIEQQSATAALCQQLQTQADNQQQSKDEMLAIIDDLRQEQARHKQAISFLYDQFREVSTVAFSTGNCDVHGTRLPIPEGFQRQHCSFFTAGHGNYRGSGTGDVVPTFQTGDSMVMPYSGNCELSGGAYGVWAARPVISEQQLDLKKREYKLTS